MDLNNLNLKKEIIASLKNQGIKNLNLVQEACIPLINSKKDIIVSSKTGSGKTLAFLIPILNSLNEKKHIQHLILVPTRELALQIFEEISKIIPNDKESFSLLYGGRGGELEKIKKSKILIATPGKLLELLSSDNTLLKTLNTLIIDEADQMLFLGFKDELEKIVAFSPKKRQTLCFSATLSSEVKKIAYKYTKEAELLEISDEGDSFSNILQYEIQTTARKKLNTLCSLLNSEKPFLGIIFCRTKIRADKLDQQLMEKGYSCQILHSDIPQSKREKIIKSFRNLESNFLIATDIASRGLDIQGVTHVFNYDTPESSELYVHRSGRTGRNKEKGSVFTLTISEDLESFNLIKKELNISPIILEVEYPTEIVSSLEFDHLKYDKRVHISNKKVQEIKAAKMRNKARDRN